MTPFISIFASAFRPKDWEKFYTTLIPTAPEYAVPIEIVFAGPAVFKNKNDFPVWQTWYKANKHPSIVFKHILTDDIEPAACYEIARRECTGELIHWSADDSEYSPDCIYKFSEFYKKFPEDKKRLTVFSIQTVENNLKCDMTHHSFFGHHPETPLMAPLGILNGELFEEIGGIDSRYTGGQWENDVVMRIGALGGSVVVFDEGFMTIPHYEKHTRQSRVRLGYPNDRKILEDSWSKNGEVTFNRYDTFVPYTKEETK